MRTNFMVQQNPCVKVLSDDMIKEIHGAALEILADIGNKVEEQEALDLFKKAGCNVSADNVVKVPIHVVEEAMRAVPTRIHLSNRNGERALNLGGTNSYFSPTAACPKMYDPHNGEKRDWKKEDIANVAKIVDYLPNMDAIFPLGSLAHQFGTDCFVHEFDAMLRNTTKPIIFLAHSKKDLKVIVDMAIEVAGSHDELIQNPFLLFYDEVLAPLYHKKETVKKMLYMTEMGLPVRYGSLTMSGASSPVTLAGVLAQSYAEALFGLVMVQLKRPGNPYMMAILPGVMDLKTGSLSSGAPEYDLLQMGYAEICRYYELPVMTTNGISDSKIPDEQAAIETTLCCLSAAVGGSNLSIGAGSLECHLIGSMEMIALADEALGMIKRIFKGINVDENGLALDVIGEVGPRGNYLGTQHTLDNFKTEHWKPSLMDRSNYDAWEKAGSKPMRERLNEKVRYIISEHQPESLNPEVSNKLLNYL